MKDTKKTEFPGKMDKTTKRTYKTTYKMGYGKLKHVKLFEEFDNDDDMDSKVNEGTYTDFLSSHGNELATAVKKMKQIATVYDDKIEDKADEVEKAMEKYDENVGQQLDSWTGDSNISTDKIAKFAVENQDKYGTEPKMVLDAIDDLFYVFLNK